MGFYTHTVDMQQQTTRRIYLRSDDKTSLTPEGANHYDALIVTSGYPTYFRQKNYEIDRSLLSNNQLLAGT